MLATAHANGFVAELFQYDEYGRMSGNVGASYPFRYTGQRWDNNIGMYYYKARHYDPQMGRFLQPDPIGYGDGLNMYGYVGGDPVNLVDPSGTQAANLDEGADNEHITCPGSRIRREDCGGGSGNIRFGFGSPGLSGGPGGSSSLFPTFAALQTFSVCVDGGQGGCATTVRSTGIATPLDGRTAFLEFNPFGQVLGDVFGLRSVNNGRLALEAGNARGAAVGFGTGGVQLFGGAIVGRVATRLFGRFLNAETALGFGISSRISPQRQGRHLIGNQRGRSFLNTIDDAQTLLDQFHSGFSRTVGTNRRGFPIVQSPNIRGTNVNPRSNFPAQQTDTFIIKGTRSPSVVPTTPAGN